MEYEHIFKIVHDLKLGEEIVVYADEQSELSLIRPQKQFKNYDLNKNFQIFIIEGERKFRPNHLRIIIDLHLRVRSRPELKKELLKAFDQIFYRKNPDDVIKSLKNEKFDHSLNSLGLIATLSQLFIIEQEYNYIGESNYDPPTLFYQGWIRQAIDSSKEIDNLAMSVCNRQPPLAKYTSLENKKNKKYIEDIKPLWYLD